MIVTFTYNRLHMLIEQAGKLVNPLIADQWKVIIDDGSDYPIKNLQKIGKRIDPAVIHRFQHVGKPGFWQLWDFALQACEKSEDELYIFLQDDVTNIDWQRILDTHDKLKHIDYACQLINDDRGQLWTSAKPQPFDDELTRVDWTDCLFFCNRRALEWIGYEMRPVPKIRFTQKGISSGVGEQLTKRFNYCDVPIYRPKTSFCHHGDHPSVMHPEERIKNPIITK